MFATFEETKTYGREKRRARERTFLKMSTLGPRLHAIALKALEFPRILSPSFTKDVCVASVYNSETSREYRELVLWLENTKIRKLKREGGEREKLLSETLEDEAWSKNYEAYLKACECDETHLTCAESKIDFLINLALAEEYRDRFDIAEEEEEKEEKELPFPISQLFLNETHFSSRMKFFSFFVSFTKKSWVFGQETTAFHANFITHTSIYCCLKDGTDEEGYVLVSLNRYIYTDSESAWICARITSRCPFFCLLLYARGVVHLGLVLENCGLCAIDLGSEKPLATVQ